MSKMAEGGLSHLTKAKMFCFFFPKKFSYLSLYEISPSFCTPLFALLFVKSHLCADRTTDHQRNRDASRAFSSFLELFSLCLSLSSRLNGVRTLNDGERGQIG